jgi:putative FmdB family regulatory protein
MPIYEYECGSCARRVEVIHGIHSPGPGTCEACGGSLRKLLSPPAIVFKGSGWAKKDARSAGAGRSTPGTGADTKGSAEGASSREAEAGGGSAEDRAVAKPASSGSGSGSEPAAPSSAGTAGD